MPMSLKCMIDKWLHKGQISQEEYDAVMKKLDGHDKQIRAEAIEDVMFAFKNYQNMNNPQNAHIFWEMLEQMQKGAEEL